MKKAYDVGELKKQGGPGRTVAYGEIRSGRLKAKKMGRRTVVLDEDLQAYLASLPAAGTSAHSDDNDGGGSPGVPGGRCDHPSEAT